MYPSACDKIYHLGGQCLASWWPAQAVLLRQQMASDPDTYVVPGALVMLICFFLSGSTLQIYGEWCYYIDI